MNQLLYYRRPWSFASWLNTPCSIVASQSSTFALSSSARSCCRRSFARCIISRLFSALLPTEARLGRRWSITLGGGAVPGTAGHGLGAAEEALDIEGVTVVVEVATCSEGKVGAGDCDTPLRKREEEGGCDCAFD